MSQKLSKSVHTCIDIGIFNSNCSTETANEPLRLLILQKLTQTAALRPIFASFLPAAVDVLNPHGIAKLLEKDLNRRFVDIITAIAISGVRVGFEGSLTDQTPRPNHAYILAYLDVISNSIQSEISKLKLF